MTRINSDLLIEIFIIRCENTKKIVKIIRSYSNEPISEILFNLKNKKSVYCTKLLVNEFYLGWKLLSDLIDELLAAGIFLEITVNGKLVDLNFIKKLKSKVNAIERKDIY